MLGARLRAVAPYACALLNLIAAGALLFVLRPGTEVEPDAASRIAYITNNEFLWRAGWGEDSAEARWPTNLLAAQIFTSTHVA